MYRRPAAEPAGKGKPWQLVVSGQTSLPHTTPHSGQAAAESPARLAMVSEARRGGEGNERADAQGRVGWGVEDGARGLQSSSSVTLCFSSFSSVSQSVTAFTGAAAHLVKAIQALAAAAAAAAAVYRWQRAGLLACGRRRLAAATAAAAAARLRLQHGRHLTERERQ